MADAMDIEYKEFSLGMLESFRKNRDEGVEVPLLPMLVEKINGVPLEECDSKLKMRAGFEVMRFLAAEMKDLAIIGSSNTNDAGDSSKA